MDYFERKIDSSLKYSGVIVDVHLDHAELDNGNIVKREVVNHPGGVGIIPLDDEYNCYMVKQFRYPIQKSLLEIPAGKLEKGEDPFECAVRELSEETGLTAGEYVYLGCFYTSPGFSDEVIHLYLARKLKSGAAHPDENEFLNIVIIPLKKLIDDIMNGKISDAKTVIGLLKTNKIVCDSK